MAKPQKASMMPALEKAEDLLSHSSSDVRSETATAVAAEYARGDMTARERSIAVGILEIMARDVEQQVRAALSEQVKNCPFLPHGLAKTLADDIESVALPMIQFSSVLSDADLIAIIESGSVDKQVAVARRETVSTQVSDRLVETDNEVVVGTLLDNKAAEISEAGYARVLTRFDGNEAIQARMVDRPSLPLSIVERLVSTVSVEFRERIIDRHDFPAELADKLVNQGREGALTRTVAGEARVAEVEGLIMRLKAKGQLTPTLILRALCEGDLHFFEAAIAAMAGVSVEKARPFLYERGAGGLRMIFRNTGLPNEMFRAVKVSLEEIGKLREEGETERSQAFSDRIVQRLVEEYEELAPEGLENVLAQLSHRIFGRWEEEPQKRIAPAYRW